MIDINPEISSLIANQFPEFYQTEGPTFIAFVVAYFTWMESLGKPISVVRSAGSYQDIDTTIDEFIPYFKSEYLAGLPAVTLVDRKLLVKKILDLYKSKGSLESYKLLFRILFGEEIEVYNPANDILKPSDGVWILPKYIEVVRSDRTASFKGKKITGVNSGATGFVESINRRRIDGRFIDVLYLSDIRGQFRYGEVVTDDGIIAGAPTITGSLTNIEVIEGGANNAIGDVFEISGPGGVGGLAKVTAVEDGTGKVQFTLIDGGSGYSNTSSVYVSDKVFFTTTPVNTNTSVNFRYLETLQQNVVTFGYNSLAGANSFAVNSAVSGYYANGFLAANGSVVVSVANNSTTGNLTILSLGGNWTAAGSIRLSTNNSVNALSVAVANTNRTATLIATNATAVGVINPSNTFYIGPVVATTTNTTTNVLSISTGSQAGFAIGALSDTETISIFTDFVRDYNSANVAFLNMLIDGTNSYVLAGNGVGTITCNTNSAIVTGNATTFGAQFTANVGGLYRSNVFIGSILSITNTTSLTLASNAAVNVANQSFQYSLGWYGFPKSVSSGINSIMLDALGVNTYTIGTISSLKSINPGNDYNVNPFVVVRNDYVADYDRKNFFVQIANSNFLFSEGQLVVQTVTSNNVVIGVGNTALFPVGTGVTQNVSTAVVASSNSTTVTVTSNVGSFVVGLNLQNMSTSNTANVTSVSTIPTNSVARGAIISANATSLEVKRTSFNTSLTPNFQINSLYANGAISGIANVISVSIDSSSTPMGENAIVNTGVFTATGVATEVDVLSSGFGYSPNTTLTLTSSNNDFVITGSADIVRQGLAEGYWKDNRGKLNSNMYIHDNYYYQEYAYEIQSGIPFDSYADILKEIFHISGTELFGKVIKKSVHEAEMYAPASVISIS